MGQRAARADKSAMPPDAEVPALRSETAGSVGPLVRFRSHRDTTRDTNRRSAAVHREYAYEFASSHSDRLLRRGPDSNPHDLGKRGDGRHTVGTHCIPLACASAYDRRGLTRQHTCEEPPGAPLPAFATHM